VILLGFDTATPATAVALRLDDGSGAERRDDPPPGAHPGHATRLLTLAAELLEACEVEWSRLQRIAVGVGPGTFTGLRVGVATARGLAQALGAELVGVSSLQTLAAGAADAAQDGRVLAVLDARRGEIFVGAYEAAAPAPRELAAPRAVAPAELAAALPAAGPWLAVGDGSVRYRAELESAGAVVPDDASPLHLISAAALCELAEPASPAAALELVTPDYIRRPDAEIALGAAAARADSQR
jgi:tRNA threonylcarbamoyladenosine biosynthesis protein TsaB